jgi:hypothetical protein
VIIAAPEVMERDADLQDSLIELPDLAPLQVPKFLQHFVLLEEAAAVEFVDSFQQQGRGRFLAGIHA